MQSTRSGFALPRWCQVAFNSTMSRSSPSGLTLQSTGRSTACRLQALHFILGLTPPCRSAPVTSNVSPLILLRRKFSLPNAPSCFVSFCSATASVRPLASAPSERSALVTLRQRSWLCRSSNVRFCPSFGTAVAEHSSPGTQCSRSSGISAKPARAATRNAKHSVWLRSAALVSSGVQLNNEPQFTERANPSVNRTLHGMPASGPPFHSGPYAVMPFRAGYLER